MSISAITNTEKQVQPQLPRSISLSWFTLFCAIWLISVYNIPFWNAVIRTRIPFSVEDIPFILSAFTILVLIFNSLLALLTFPRVAKLIIIVLILLSAIAASFALRLGTLIDKSMVQNVFETDWTEAASLLNLTLLLDFSLLGLLPAAVISRTRVRFESFWCELRKKTIIITFGISVALLLVWIFSAEYASMLRNHRELRFMLTPANIITSTYGHLKQRYKQPLQIETAKDVRKVANPSIAGKPLALVLVIGETARAADFSLNGHDRRTNPLLETKNVIYFSNVKACGTSTAVSLPCMFSDLGETGYSLSRARNRDNLIDVLTHSGLDVIWLDNNSGCKNICTRATYESLTFRNDSSVCDGKECLDELFVKALHERLTDLKRDTVLVLHMKGSHGPAYFRRYPQRFEAFKPACKSVDLSSCDSETIHNAYDNTILYTDFVLASIIDTLVKNAQRISSALFYVSDHGESLGENGMYLHGMPKLIAPRTQIEIPIIVWLSDEFSARIVINQDCIKDKRQQSYSHDNVFHTILGFWNIKTNWYKSSLDMFALCRRPLS